MNNRQLAVLNAIKTACGDRAASGATARLVLPMLHALAILAEVDQEAQPFLDKYASTIGANGYHEYEPAPVEATP